MGTRHDKTAWTSIFKLARKNRKDPYCTFSSREQQSQILSSRDQEESDRWVEDYFELVEALHKLYGNKL